MGFSSVVAKLTGPNSGQFGASEPTATPPAVPVAVVKERPALSSSATAQFATSTIGKKPPGAGELALFGFDGGSDPVVGIPRTDLDTGPRQGPFSFPLREAGASITETVSSGVERLTTALRPPPFDPRGGVIGPGIGPAAPDRPPVFANPNVTRTVGLALVGILAALVIQRLAR